jgi:hypothetical protein
VRKLLTTVRYSIAGKDIESWQVAQILFDCAWRAARL